MSPKTPVAEEGVYTDILNPKAQQKLEWDIIPLVERPVGEGCPEVDLQVGERLGVTARLGEEGRRDEGLSHDHARADPLCETQPAEDRETRVLGATPGRDRSPLTCGEVLQAQQRLLDGGGIHASDLE